MIQDNNKPIQILSKFLALNFYNLSIAEEDKETIREGVFNHINGESKFTRNILIEGAGASAQAFPKLQGGAETILRIEKRLGLYDRLGFERIESEKRIIFRPKVEINYNLNHALNQGSRTQNILVHSERIRYCYETSLILGRRVEIDTLQLFLEEQTSFELRLQLLLRFYTAQVVDSALNKEVEQKYIPNLFYEISAHMLKHRFIDIIVDTNFDELQMSSIEDEFGDADCHTVITKDEIKDVSDFMSKHRLRIPIYIKPHGTFSRHRTLQYTNEHYENQSPEMKSLLGSLFSGSVGGETKVDTVNFIVVGHGLNDDLKYSIIDALQGGTLKEVNFFCWSDKDPLKRVSNLLKEFVSEKLPSGGEVFKINDSRKRKSSKSYKWTAKSENLCINVYGMVGYNYSCDFSDLYSNMQTHFKKPYVPRSIGRHSFICNTLSDYIQSQDFNLSQLAYFKYRLHLAYDVFKFNFKVPENEVLNGRGAKYLRLVISNDLKSHLSIVSTLKNHSTYKGVKHEIGSHFEIKSPKTPTEIVEELAQLVAGEEVDESLERMQNVRSCLTECLNDISTPLEICHQTHSYSSLLFKKIDSRNYIYNNLGLTYQFIQRVTDFESYDSLYLTSRSGRALFHLANKDYLSGNRNYLKMMSELGKNIELIVRGESKYISDKGDAVPVLGTISKIYDASLLGCKIYNSSHHMAIFTKNGIPVSAIYYYLPMSHNRISPFRFQGSDDKPNMKLLFGIFKEEYGRGKELAI